MKETIKKLLREGLKKNIFFYHGTPDKHDFNNRGQIHNVKQLFNKHKDNWDSLTFSDLLRLSPPLSTVNNELSKGDRVQWIRDLKTRMHREGLLGKNMANS